MTDQSGLILDAPTSEALLDAMEGIAYLVDDKGLIQAVGGRRWKSFACENGAEALAEPPAVVRRPILGFVQGDEVRRSYARFLQTLRDGRREAVRFSYRCDAPETRREMRMCISAVRAGDKLTGFLFQSLVLTEESRPPVDLFDPEVIKAEVAAQARLPIVHMCSYCQRVRSDCSDGEQEWVTAEAYYGGGGTSRVRISHGICPECINERLEPMIG